MQPKKSPEALAEQLLLLTLALEQSLRNEDWEESQNLIKQREKILGRLEKMSLSQSTQKIVKRVQWLEEQLMGSLKQWRTGVLNEIQRGQQGKKAAGAYAPAASGAVFYDQLR